MPLALRAPRCFIRISKALPAQALGYPVCKAIVGSADLGFTSCSGERSPMNCVCLCAQHTVIKAVSPGPGAGPHSAAPCHFLSLPSLSRSSPRPSQDAAKRFQAQEQRDGHGWLRACVQDAFLSFSWGVGGGGGRLRHVSIHLNLRRISHILFLGFRSHKQGALILGPHLHCPPPAAAFLPHSPSGHFPPGSPT